VQAINEDDVAAVMHEVVHEALGSELTLAEAEKMVEEVDHEHAGKISLQEVRRITVSHSQSTAIHSADPMQLPLLPTCLHRESIQTTSRPACACICCCVTLARVYSFVLALLANVAVHSCAWMCNSL
jgi:hypothetical protein